MEMEIKKSDIELVIKCTKVELGHVTEKIREGFQALDDDMDDCDCGKLTCYECTGYKTFKKFLKFLENQIS